jgi:integrase
MPTVIERADGRRELRIVINGRRHMIGLGHLDRRHAELVGSRVERLLSAQTSGGFLGADMISWIESLDRSLLDRLIKIGIVPEHVIHAVLKSTLAQLIETATASAAVKASTAMNYASAWKRRVKHFGADRPIKSITVADCGSFKAAPLREGYAATVARTVKHARYPWNVAIREGRVDANPWTQVKAGSMANPERLTYIPTRVVDKVIEYCADMEWKLVFAFARYAGTRTPSEPFAMTWSDVLWEEQRRVVRSPKTAHTGKANRIVPMLAPLRRLLEQAFAAAPAGQVHILPRLRSQCGSIGVPARRLIESAGVRPWPRTFNALRASRATDWAKAHPAFVCHAWLGHTAVVAEQHYLMPGDDDYAKAVSASESGHLFATPKAAQESAPT